jgi:hypothetical protein
MKGFSNTQLSAAVHRELEAIDAALRGQGVEPRHTQLAELAHELRQSRARPAAEFVRALDARAARGFMGEAAAAHRARRARWPKRRLRLRHAASPPRQVLAAAFAALIAVAVALPLTLPGGKRGSERARVTAPARSAPATAAAPVHGDAVPAYAQRAQPAAHASATTASTAAASGQRQVERATALDVGVAPDAIQSSSQQVFTLVNSFGGYVRQSNVSAGTLGQAGASFDLRVPSANLSGALAALSHLGRVRSETDETDDVTEQFNSLHAALADLQAERSSLLKQLAAASEAQQEAALRARVRAVETRISQLEGQLTTLRSRVDYTSVALTLTAEAPLGSTQGDLTPGGAARDAGQVLEAALAVIVIAAAAVVPLAALGFAGWVAMSTTRRRLREQALDAST